MAAEKKEATGREWSGRVPMGYNRIIRFGEQVGCYVGHL